MPVVDVTADLFAADYSGSATPLDLSHGRTFQEVLSAAGGFSLKLQNGDADLPACSFGKIVRFSINAAPCFAGLIEAKTVVRVAAGEDADQLTELKGRGTLALHDSFVVYPEIFDNPLVGDTRFFTFASTLFDDTGWPDVTAVDLDTAEQDAPANWPDTTTKKIRPGGSPTVDRDPEEFGVRKVFSTTGGDKTYRLYFTGDDGVDIFVDGVRIVEEVRPRMWQETRQADVRLRDGSQHLIAIKGTNIDFPGDNYSWVAAALYNVEPDGTLGALVVQTDATWLGVQFGTTPPGFTPGAVLTILRDEAVARGVDVPTFDFDADVDSDGTPWPVAPDISFRVGLKGLPALLQLAETYCDLSMAPDSLTLHAWVHGAKGGPTATEFVPGSNVLEMGHEVSG